MPITLEKHPKELRFVVSGTIAYRILEWKDKMDKMVFEEQLAAISSPNKRRQQRAYEEGKVLPYYGWGGSWGGYSYSLQVMDGLGQVSVQNMLTQVSQAFSEKSSESLSDNTLEKNV